MNYVHVQRAGFDGCEDGYKKILELYLHQLKVGSQVCPSRELGGVQLGIVREKRNKGGGVRG